MQGSKRQAEDGTLVMIAAGDRSLFDDCQSCFQAMSHHSFFLGDVSTISPSTHRQLIEEIEAEKPIAEGPRTRTLSGFY